MGDDGSEIDDAYCVYTIGGIVFGKNGKNQGYSIGPDARREFSWPGPTHYLTKIYNPPPHNLHQNVEIDCYANGDKNNGPHIGNWQISNDDFYNAGRYASATIGSVKPGKENYITVYWDDMDGTWDCEWDLDAEGKKTNTFDYDCPDGYCAPSPR